MNTTTQVIGVDNIEVSIKVTTNIAEWKVIRDALKKGREGYYGAAQALLERIDNSIGKIERQIESENFDVSKNERNN